MSKLPKEKISVRENTVYHKIGKRYIPVGYDWHGFPMDGVWLVQDGKCSMSCLIGAKERVPIFALNYRLHEQDLCKRIQERHKEAAPRGLSLMDEARLCCDYFAEIAESTVKEG